MPSSKSFGFKIIIGNQEMKEYWLKNQCYVPINLHTKNSFVIELALNEENESTGPVGQIFRSNQWSTTGSSKAVRYPVTPFQIKVQKYVRQPCWVSVEMDGELICCQLLKHPSQTRFIDGRRYGDEIRELAFSLPLLTQEGTGANQERIDAAGTITLKLLEAINNGVQMYYPAVRTQANYLPQGTFPQLSKRDISQKENLGAVVREGRTFLKISYKEQKSARIQYIKGKVVDEQTLHYRPLESLLDLGIISPEEYTNLKASLVAEVPVEPVVPPNSQKTNNTAEEVPEASIGPLQSNTAIVSLPTEQKPTVMEEIVTNAVLVVPVEPIIQTDSIKVDKTANEVPKASIAPVQCNTTINQELTVRKKEVKAEGESSRDGMTSNFDKMKLEVQESDADAADDDDVIYLDTSYENPHDMICYGEKLVPLSGDDSVICMGDESVICMGDDSCYEFDVTPQEISMVDLTTD